MQGLNLGTGLRTVECVDTGGPQLPSEALRLFQGHESERMRARSRNRIVAAAPSNRCFRRQAEDCMQRSSQAAGCVGFRERWLFYRLRE
jgi:hypothetical protein